MKATNNETLTIEQAERIHKYMEEMKGLEQFLVTKRQVIELVDIEAMPLLIKEEPSISDEKILQVLKSLRAAVIELKPYPKKGKKAK